MGYFAFPSLEALEWVVDVVSFSVVSLFSGCFICVCAFFDYGMILYVFNELQERGSGGEAE